MKLTTVHLTLSTTLSKQSPPICTVCGHSSFRRQVILCRESCGVGRYPNKGKGNRNLSKPHESILLTWVVCEEELPTPTELGDMERTEQGSPHEEGDMQDSPDLESKKNHEKYMNKTCFCDRSPVQVEKIIFLSFVFFDFPSRESDAQKSILTPRTRCPRSIFQATKNYKKTWKTWFLQFFSSSNVGFSKAFAEKTKKWILFSHRFLFLSVCFQKQKCKIC